MGRQYIPGAVSPLGQFVAPPRGAGLGAADVSFRRTRPRPAPQPAPAAPPPPPPPPPMVVRRVVVSRAASRAPTVVRPFVPLAAGDRSSFMAPSPRTSSLGGVPYTQWAEQVDPRLQALLRILEEGVT